MNAFVSLFEVLLLTLAIEVPLGILLLRQKSALLPLVLINLLTNPTLNAVLLILYALNKSYAVYLIAVVIGEVVVFISEAFLLHLLCVPTLKRSFLISTVLNAVSLALGSAVAAII